MVSSIGPTPVINTTEPPPALSKDNLSHLYATGYTLYRNGMYKDARDFFKFVTYADPQDRRSWIGLGACYQMMKLFQEAIECYSVAAIQNPDDPYAHLHAAECLHHLGKIRQSIETLDSAKDAAKLSISHRNLLENIELLKKAWSEQAQGGTHG